VTLRLPHSSFFTYISKEFRMRLVNSPRLRRLLPGHFALVAGIALAGSITASSAHAEMDDDAVNESTFLGDGTSITIGTGPLLTPAYDGAKKEKITAFPFIKIDGLLNDYLSISTGRGVAVNVLGSGNFHAGFALGYDSGRSASDDSHLRGTSDISASVAPGAFISYDFDPFSVALDVKERLGDHSGTTATLAGLYSFKPLPKLKLAIGPKVTFADRKYNQAYFGVTEDEAVQATALGNPLHAYSAKAGIQDVGLSMTAFYDLSDHWRLAGIAGVSELLSKDAESPLVQHRFQPELGLGVLYKF
jgi:MipA family protein